MTQPKPTRNPAGLVKERPIALRLMPDELADAERISSEERQSESLHARQCYLAGKAILYPPVSKSTSSTSPRKRVKRGNGGSPVPASFSIA